VAVAAVGCALLLAACAKTKKEDLNPSPGGCVTTGISFSADIQPVLQSKCLNCHGVNAYEFSGGRRNLDGYAQVSLFVQNGLLMKSIRHEAPASPMPRNAAKLDDCTIARFQAWVNAGAPNN